MTEYEQSEEYKSRCMKRRILGIVMLAVAGAYLIAVTGAQHVASDAYNAGRYAVPALAFVVAAFCLLTKPAVKR